ncbi:MAG: exosome complex exonuclease Rrp41 [Nanoarchaeota archaeon]|nr:exosome complex exonuclease Rrp41 [Nanoarchaeota archaeon]
MTKLKRKDNRKADVIRPISIQVGVIPNANGSAMVSIGRTTAIAAVYGPRELHPRRLQIANKGVLRTIYSMLPFSVDERIRPGPSRRSSEICKVTRQALEPALYLEEFPKATIDVYINILQADAGTRTAGINAASAALADAGIPMRDLVGSMAAGKIGDDIVLDLEGKEEEETDCDLPVAYMPNSKKITLLQFDGDMPPADVKKVVKLAIKGCEIMYEKQKEALRDKWVGAQKK